MKAWIAVVLGLAVACGDPEPTGTVRLALNWFPESEHGGYFAAVVNGLFTERKLAVEIRPGGPGVPVIPRVANREVDFGIVNADDVVAARAAGVPVVALLAPIHRSPLCVMVHAESGITRLFDLHDLTLAMGTGTPHLAWLERHASLPGVQMVPYGGSIAPFLAEPRYAQQAYVFSEPILARAKGADVRCLMFADAGYDPYASTLVTSEALLRDHPDLARDMTVASAKGWDIYARDPGPTNALILTRNPEIGRTALDQGADALRPLVLDDAATRDGLGSMSPDRWATLAQQMQEIGAIDNPIDPASLYDARFVPPASR